MQLEVTRLDRQVGYYESCCLGGIIKVHRHILSGEVNRTGVRDLTRCLYAILRTRDIRLSDREGVTSDLDRDRNNRYCRLAYAYITTIAVNRAGSLEILRAVEIVLYNGRRILNEFYIRRSVSEMPNNAIRHEVRFAFEFYGIFTAEVVLFVRRELFSVDINRL